MLLEVLVNLQQKGVILREAWDNGDVVVILTVTDFQFFPGVDIDFFPRNIHN